MDNFSRQDAFARGLLFYCNGRPCKRGHICLRRTSTNHCLECLAINRGAWAARLGPDGRKEAQREADARYKQRNPEKKSANSKAAVERMVQKDPECRRRQVKAWRKANPEMKRAQAQRHYEKCKRERRDLLRLRRAASAASARAKANGTPKPDSFTEIVRRVWEKSNGLCAACGSPESLELDHKTPVCRGGSNNENNLQFLCKPCNRSKGALDWDEWRSKRTIFLEISP